MKAQVRAALEGEPRTDRVLVAVSGGIDSMVLLELLASLAPELRLSLGVAHVHHGLRDEADADAEAVADAAARLGLPFHLERIAPRALRAASSSSRERPTLQEASRRLRYESLGALARNFDADAVATAHNRDDQVETLLLRLLRGSGPDGLAGMRARRVFPQFARRVPPGRPLYLLRPLLEVSRAEIVEFARAHGVSWREDHSNSDWGYTRNRLREEWLPALREAFNPRLDQALLGLREAVAEERDWLQHLEDREAAARLEPLGDGSLRIDIKEWGGLPDALARRLARRALQEMGAGRDVSRTHLARMLAFLGRGPDQRGGKRLELPGGLRLVASGDRDSPAFRLERAPLPPAGGC